jgi:hypothetical protein
MRAVRKRVMWSWFREEIWMIIVKQIEIVKNED